MNFTPEPHHIPGYAGFTPQCRFRSGKTFSATTAQIFRDPTVCKSNKPVLVDLDNMTKELCLFHIKNRYWNEKFLDKDRSRTCSGNGQEDSKLGTAIERCNTSFMPSIRSPPKVYGQHDAITRSSKYFEETAGVENSSRKFNNGETVQPVETKDCQELKGFTSGQDGRGANASLELSSRRKLTNPCMTRSLTSNDLTPKPRIESRNSYLFEKNQQQRFYNPCEGMIARYQGHVPGEKFDFGKSFKPSTAFCLKQKSEMLGY